MKTKTPAPRTVAAVLADLTYYRTQPNAFIYEKQIAALGAELLTLA